MAGLCSAISRAGAVLTAAVLIACSGPGGTDVEPPAAAATCGNGRLDEGERCDPLIASGEGACPATCADGDACTQDALEGSAATCTAACVHAAATGLRCATGDGCCAPGCTANDDGECAPRCGNGSVETGETCDGNCPAACDDGAACTADSRAGSDATCDVACAHAPLEACVAGDGCCPAVCTSITDSDCSPSCGNGAREPGETCDKGVASGPDVCGSDCDDGDACTDDTALGSAANCSAECAHAAVTACRSGDGCCAPGCTAANDDDCTPACGNRAVEPGETCDGNCPAACDDGAACTADSRTGSDATCDIACTHASIDACIPGDGCCPAACTSLTDADCSASCGNGVREAGEACDSGIAAGPGACPADCDDGDACSQDTAVGSAANCSAECAHAAITACRSADGCCPAGCIATNDDDCAPTCGNGVVERGETCDGNCAATCADADACTTDTSSGSAASCDLVCARASVTTCVAADGCCPSACSATSDSDCGPRPPGDRCVDAPVLVPGTLTAQSLAGLSNDAEAGTGCVAAAGPDRFYALTIPAGHRLSVTVTPASAAFDPTLSLVLGASPACVDAGACVAAADRGYEGDPETLSYVNATASPLAAFLVVDTFPFGADTTFELAMSLTAPEAGETCGAPVLAPAPGTLRRQTTSAYSDEFPAGEGCSGRGEAARLYVLDVPAGRVLRATATPSTAGDLRLNLFRGSATDCVNPFHACAASADQYAEGLAETLSWANAGTAAERVWLAIETSLAGGFELATELLTPVRGDSCALPAMLAGPGTTSGETLAGAFDDFVAGGYCEGTPGPDRVYSISVPAGARLTASADATQGASPFVTITAAGCGTASGACAQAEDGGAGTSGSPSLNRWTNESGAAATAFVRVDTQGTPGPFVLVTQLDTPAAGETCSTAIALAPGSSTSGQTTGATDDYAGDGAGCDGFTGVDRVFEVGVPAGRTLVARLVPQAGFDPTLNALLGAGPAACIGNPRRCVAASDFVGAGRPEAVRVPNPGTASQRAYLVVDSSLDAAAGGFVLETALDAFPGDSCATASALALPANVANELLAGFANDVELVTTCSTYPRSTERVYSVSVPAGRELVATVRPKDRLDLVLALVDAAGGCAPGTRCLTRSDSGIENDAETIRWTNTGAANASVLLVVENYNDIARAQPGRFDLAVSLTP